MQTAPLTDWSPDNREQHFHQVVSGGWMHIPPQRMSLLLMGLTSQDRPLTREEVSPFVRSAANPDGDLGASCWEDDSTLDEDELADQPAKQADAARYAAHYGLPPMQTLDDMLTLLLAAGVVHQLPDSAGVLRLHPAHPLPRPEEVFPLDEEELAVQRELRRETAYGGDSSKIISLFDPLGERRKEITTSLERLARVIDGHPHDARQAVQLLLDDGDFTANLDIAHVPPHKVFRLRCDWAAFDAHRISIHGLDDRGRIRVTLPADTPSLGAPAGD